MAEQQNSKQNEAAAPKTKTTKIFVLSDSYVDINGKRTKYPQGLTDAPTEHANILITAGYAKSAEPEKK